MRVENGKLRFGRGKLRVGKGKLRIESGELGVWRHHSGGNTRVIVAVLLQYSGCITRVQWMYYSSTVDVLLNEHGVAGSEAGHDDTKNGAALLIRTAPSIEL